MQNHSANRITKVSKRYTNRQKPVFGECIQDDKTRGKQDAMGAETMRQG